jgi:hypothetical protein
MNTINSLNVAISTGSTTLAPKAPIKEIQSAPLSPFKADKIDSFNQVAIKGTYAPTMSSISELASAVNGKIGLAHAPAYNLSEEAQMDLFGALERD